MRSDVVRRSHTARPRRDTIAVTIPKKAVWIGAGVIAGFGISSLLIGIWIGRGTADRPAPVAAPLLAENEPDTPPPPPAEELIEEPPPSASPKSAPKEPERPRVKLDLRERMPRGRHGLQVGAFQSREEAREFLESHATEFAGHPMYMLPAKGSRGSWVRVRVGSFDTAADAEKARKALPEELRRSSMVVRYN